MAINYRISIFYSVFRKMMMLGYSKKGSFFSVDSVNFHRFSKVF